MQRLIDSLAGAALLIGVLAGAAPPTALATDLADDGNAQAAAAPMSARELVDAARAAAAEDRHHDAVAAYLEAIAADPDLAPTIAHELAFQKLWREDAEQSIFYFRRFLARDPGGDHRDVRKGLALAFSWSGRQGDAADLYRELLDEDGDDDRAQVGLGRALVWDNRLHEGFGILRAVEDRRPAAGGGADEARDILLTALDGYTPHLELRLTTSWDSDDLDIVRLGLSGTTTVAGNNLLQVTPVAARYRQPGQPDVRGLRLGGGLIAPLAHNWTFHGYAWLDRFRSDAPAAGSTVALAWDRGGGDAWLTWLPAARWRLDFGATSEPVETYIALQDHIGLRRANASADWRIARAWNLGWGGSLGDYSDGNSNRRGQVRLTWRREGRWSVHLGPTVTVMDFAEAYPGGYWAPDRVRNGSIEATFATRGTKTTLRLGGSVGLEKETGAETTSVGSVSARLGWRLAPGWLAALEAGHGQSSFSSAGGYSRTSASLALRALF